MGVGPSVPTKVLGLTPDSRRKEENATPGLGRPVEPAAKPVLAAEEVKHEKKWVVFEEFYDPCTWSEPVCFFESREEAEKLCARLLLLSSKLVDGTATHYYVNPILSGLSASAKVLEDLEERVASQVVTKEKSDLRAS